ncbi:MAG: 3'-5' exonuclease domain-containing protein 2, partial [Candidatus Cloacimonetes bacterium]|nr:3'-5' exonuclease domain-containing protein 2 [Candidatus Cloacimonadota bacterium]
RDELNSLPLNSFKGNIRVIEDLEEINEVLPLIQKAKWLGFDTETRPSFRKGPNNRIALLQLATENEAFLFRINKIKLPDALVRILSDPDLIKVGAAIHDDIKGLQKYSNFVPAGFVELQNYVTDFGIESNGLRKLAGIVLNFRISKRYQVSNWENKKLSEGQIQYAATDAWVSYKVYSVLKNSTI